MESDFVTVRGVKARWKKYGDNSFALIECDSKGNFAGWNLAIVYLSKTGLATKIIIWKGSAWLELADCPINQMAAMLLAEEIAIDRDKLQFIYKNGKYEVEGYNAK